MCDTAPTFEVITPGTLSLFQDEGRKGFAHLGVPGSGFFDRASATLANRSVGNIESAPVIESLLGELTITALKAATVIVTGAPVTIDIHSRGGGYRQEHSHRLIDLTAGDTLRIGRPTSGLRTYFAVRGGFHCEPVLGSCSHDTMSSIGPRPLQSGDILLARSNPSQVHNVREVPPHLISEHANLMVIPGPRQEWFTAESIRYFYSVSFEVTTDINRIGVRLHSPHAINRTTERKHKELPSEGMMKGAIQIPPNGQPVIFGPDHPTTGGYPVIGVLTRASLDTVAQLPPGSAIKFSRP